MKIENKIQEYMKKLKNITFIIFILLLVTGLSIHVRSNYSKSGETKTNTAFMADSLGQRVYEKHCLTCHQKNGTGVSAMYPPIVNNPRVKGDKERLIKIIFEGQSGRIEVHGEYYNGVMPPFRNLSNTKVAALLTYMRQNFENDTTAVTVKEVKAVRDTL